MVAPSHPIVGFDAAAINLAPQQPPRVRRAWERVPTKARTNKPTIAPGRDNKKRTLWKRPEAKSTLYETEHGGTGFAVNGSKRQRMKNMPAVPVNSRRGPEREPEMEATDDELFSRRRKSGRRSSINPARKALAPHKSSAAKPRRISQAVGKSLQSPLRNNRVAELSNSPQPANKRVRASIGKVLGNGTPMRNAFAESAWAARSPTRLETHQIQSSPRVVATSPQRMQGPQHLSPQKRLLSTALLSPNKTFSPHKIASPFQMPSKPSPRKVFGVGSGCQFHLSPGVFGKALLNAQPDLLSAVGPVLPSSDQSGLPPADQPMRRRRSARLSAQHMGYLEQGDPSLSSTEEMNVTKSEESPADQTSTSVNGQKLPVSAPLGQVSLVEPVDLEQRSHSEPEEESAQQLAKELAESADSSIMDIEDAVIECRMPEVAKNFELTIKTEDDTKPRLIVDKDTRDETNTTPEKDDVIIVKPEPFGETIFVSQADELVESSNGTLLTKEAISDEENENVDELEQSEDELTARLEHWIDPAASFGTEESIRSRNAPRFSDDTTILKNFLSRAQAKRAAQALVTSSTSPAKKTEMRKSPGRKSPVKAAPTRASPRRSPRRVLEAVDGNSPSPTKTSHRARTGTPPSKSPVLFFDADESDELASPVKTTRRSTRAKPVAGKAGSAPSLIPLRRTDGQEPPRLRKTEAQELALVTRTNTRRNKGHARLVPEVLHDLSQRELSPVKDRAGRKSRKSVDWNDELLSYLGEQVEERPKEKSRAKRTQGLGTINGTPAPRRAGPRAIPKAPAPSIPILGVATDARPVASGTAVRPRPRRA